MNTQKFPLRVTAALIAALMSVSIFLSGAVSKPPTAAYDWQEETAGLTTAAQEDYPQTTDDHAQSGEAAYAELTAEQVLALEAKGDDFFYEPGEESITEEENGGAYVNDALLLFFEDGATLRQRKAALDSVEGEVVGRVAVMNQYEVKIEPDDMQGIAEKCERLMQLPGVEFASISIARKYSDQLVPDDPWAGNADWFGDYSMGAPFSTASNNWWIRAIDADKAWDYNDSFSKIKIGIVDSGFDVDHEDLQGKISFPAAWAQRTNIADSHGTHVAGIIGAIPNNAAGITGIAWNSELVCVDWQPEEDAHQYWLTGERILTGLAYTVRAGAKVINFSLGTTYFYGEDNETWQIFKDYEAKLSSFYIARLLRDGYDFIVVQSAGNGRYIEEENKTYAVDASNNGLFCPVTERNVAKSVTGIEAADILDRIIIVGAATADSVGNYMQASFSNGGSQVTICAPGQSVYSCNYNTSTGAHDLYGRKSGTSMSAPVVTAVAALVWSVEPGFTGDQVKRIVCARENTKYDVIDSEAQTHLPDDVYRMVNARLSVEAAIAKSESNAYIKGSITAGNLSGSGFKFVLVNNDSGRDQVLRTNEDGSFALSLEPASYTVYVRHNLKKYSATFSAAPGEKIQLNDLILGVPITSDTTAAVTESTQQSTSQVFETSEPALDAAA